MTTVLLVGCGNMGRAMLEGWIAAGVIAASDAHVVEPNADLRERAAASGAAVHGDADAVPSSLHPDIVLFAVKPQVMRTVVPSYGRFNSATTTFVSIAAGTPIATFEELLGQETAVIRCMPNTPAAIGKGMMVTVANANVSDVARERAEALLAANGAVARVGREELIDAVTAVSGSGPAYVFHFIEALTEAGMSAGLERDTATLLATQTVMGAGALAASSDLPASTLREQVTSPNGTTAAGLSVLMKELPDLVRRTVEAAHKRSIELRD